VDRELYLPKSWDRRPRPLPRRPHPGRAEAVRAAATDPRVRAVAGIAGAYNSPARFARSMGLDAYRSALATFLDRYDETLPAVAPGGGEAAMPGQEPYAYYGTERGASPCRDPSGLPRPRPAGRVPVPGRHRRPPRRRAPRRRDGLVQIVEWYDEPAGLTDSPVVRLDRAVAVGEADGPRAGLAAFAEYWAAKEAA